MASALHVFLLVSVGLLAASADTQGGCRDPWKRIKGRCFRFYEGPLDWISAERECIEAGGNLASIRTEDEIAVVKEMLLESAPNQLTWIGGHDGVVEGEWQWNDGSTFDFVQWPQGQPDNYANVEHCMEVRFKPDGPDHINDNDCRKAKPFLCSKTRCGSNQ